MWPIYESEHFWIGCLLVWTSLQRITAPPVHIVGQGERGYAAEWSKVMPLREVSAEYFRKHLFPDQSPTPPPLSPFHPRGTKPKTWVGLKIIVLKHSCKAPFPKKEKWAQNAFTITPNVQTFSSAGFIWWFCPYLMDTQVLFGFKFELQRFAGSLFTSEEQRKVGLWLQCFCNDNN